MNMDMMVSQDSSDVTVSSEVFALSAATVYM